jgi:hypothetical protein
MAKTKLIHVTAYPYAVVNGTIKVPADVKDVQEYVEEHFDSIKFGKPELDFKGTDFDTSEC